MNTPNKPVLVTQNKNFVGLQRQIAQQKQLLQTIQALLPKPLAEHVVHCLLRGDKLLIYTHSAAWASQLRFYETAIVAAVASCTKQAIAHAQVKILNEQPETHLERKAQLPSPERIAQLQHDSNHITDEALRGALLRLGSTLERLSKRSNN